MQRHLVRIIVVLILGSTGPLLPTTSFADESDGDDRIRQGDAEPDGEGLDQKEARRADRHYGEAVRLFGQGRYSEAVEEFDRAIALADEPLFYCNRAVAYIKLREWVAAEEDLRTCRDEFEGSTAERAEIDAEYRGLQASATGVRTEALAVARTIADEAPEPVAPKTPPGADQSPFDVELLGHLSLGTGAVLLTAAGMLDYLSADLNEEFLEESAGGPGTSRQRYEELRGELTNRKRIFTGLAIGGSVFAVSGLSILTYTWFIAEPDETGRQSVSVSPRRGGGSLVWSLRF